MSSPASESGPTCQFGFSKPNPNSPKSSQICQKPGQNLSKFIKGKSLDFLGGNEPFQRVAPTPRGVFSLSGPSRTFSAIMMYKSRAKLVALAALGLWIVVVMARLTMALISVLCKHLFQSNGCQKLASAKGRRHGPRDTQSKASRPPASRRRDLTGDCSKN
jgi:hypothetical protein